jgi:hypothetical protein
VSGCPNGTEARGDDCIPVCSEGSHLEGDRCVRDCGAGFKPAGGGRCVLDCPAGTEAVRGRCRPVEDDPCDGSNAQSDECQPLQQSSDGVGSKRREATGVDDPEVETPDNMRATAQGGCSATPVGNGPNSIPFFVLVAGCILCLRRRR